MKNFYIFLLTFLVFLQTFAEEQFAEKQFAEKQFAEEQIIGRNLQFAAYQDVERLELLEQENQRLLGRIEVVEHNIAKLEKILNSIKPGSLSSSDTSSDNMAAKNSSSDPLNDIFGTSSSKEILLKKPDDSNTIKNTVTDKQLYDLALAALKDNKLAEAESRFAEFLKNYPTSSLVSNAYFWYGESFFKRNIFDKAAINYLKGYKQAPKGAKASDSLLKLALALGSLKKNQEACAILNKLETEFPARASTSMTRAKEAKTKFGCKK